MLVSFHIENVAVIKRTDVCVGRGLDVISGETGAGKSILLDSLNFLFGSKADRSLIRFGENFMLVEAVFDITSNATVSDLIASYGIEVDDGTLVMSRKLFDDGRGECRINGRSATVSMLRDVSSQLIDILGQSEHISMLKTSNHQAIIDEYAGEEIRFLLDKIKESVDAYHDNKKALAVFGGDEKERNRLIDLYSFQIDEIDAAELTEGEEEKLREFRRRYKNAGKIRSDLSTACSALSGNGSAVDCVTEAAKALDSSCDAHLCDLANELADIRYRLSDICDECRLLLSDYDFDDSKIDANEDRLDEIKNLKRKYGDSVSAVFEYRNKIFNDLTALKNADEEIARLTTAKKKILDEYYENCLKLSEKRRFFAKSFEKKIMEQLKDLCMDGAVFEVRFEDAVSRDVVERRVSSDGIDTIEFYIAVNSGEPPKPLVKVASGGETSRFMLALKTVTASLENVDTLVFDEIDSGISGFAASKLAEKLAIVSQSRQVIAISHSQSVVAAADNNFYIFKESDEKSTYSYVKSLNEDEKIIEVARLSGFTGGSENSIKHAKDLISVSQGFKVRK